MPTALSVRVRSSEYMSKAVVMCVRGEMGDGNTLRSVGVLSGSHGRRSYRALCDTRSCLTVFNLTSYQSRSPTLSISSPRAGCCHDCPLPPYSTVAADTPRRSTQSYPSLSSHTITTSAYTPIGLVQCDASRMPKSSGRGRITDA